MQTNNAIVVSDRVLARTPALALKLLSTLSSNAGALLALQSVGFKDADFEQGWALIRSVPPVAKVVAQPTTYLDSVRELETWHGPNFTIARAALTHLHPTLADFVFNGVVEGHGIDAAVAVDKFLSNLDELENGAKRKHRRKSDHAALETLATRGITKQVRAHLGSLVVIVEAAPPTHVVEATPPTARRDALLKLHAWVTDWHDCARAVITRRDLLIRLGIGKRRSHKQATTPTPPVAATPAQPVVQEAPALAKTEPVNPITRVQNGAT